MSDLKQIYIRIEIIALLFLFSGTTLFSQSSFSARDRKIDSLLHVYSEKHSITGLSVGIVHQGKTYTYHHGFTDLQKKYPVTDSTQFLISSISKLFTTTAVFQLIESQKISVEDKIIDLIPEFRMKDQRYKDLRLKHLLTHTSGLPWDNKLKNSPDDSTAVPLTLQNLSSQKLNFEPGTQLSYKTYSNAAFDLLGMVVEQKSGISFHRYIQKNILNPLQMKRSTYFHEKVDSSRLALPQVVAGDSKKVKEFNISGKDRKKNPILNGQPLDLTRYTVYGEDYEHNASGNLISTAEELNLFMQHFLSVYQGKENGLVRTQTLKEIWTTHMSIPEKRTSMGWGWWIYEDEKYGHSVFHAGTDIGFCSILTIYPEKDFGLVLLSNALHAKDAIWNNLAEEIKALFLEK